MEVLLNLRPTAERNWSGQRTSKLRGFHFWGQQRREGGSMFVPISWTKSGSRFGEPQFLMSSYIIFDFCGFALFLPAPTGYGQWPTRKILNEFLMEEGRRT